MKAESLKLLAGQRFILEGDDKFLLTESGKIEVYAVAGDEVSFRQFFMMTVEVGEAIFPSMDDLTDIKISIYAVEDSELKINSFEAQETENLRELMSHWFKNALERMSWLKLLADKGDENLISWRRGTVLADKTTFEELFEEFLLNEQILSMFLGVRFGSEDKKLSQRTEWRLKNKKVMVENSIRKKKFYTRRLK